MICADDRAGRVDSIARYGPVFMAFNVVFLGMACSFWVDAVKSPETFSAAIWGAMAYRVPAEIWALALMASTVITILGLMHPRHRGMIAIGSFATATVQAMLEFSILESGGMDIIGRWTVVIAAFALWIGFSAVGHRE